MLFLIDVTVALNRVRPLKQPLTILLASPRGFCAGVDRAIQIVERALEKWNPPVYVRHEIVHNKHVVQQLKEKGAVFVEELNECPDDRPVIFSAHGVPKSVFSEANRRNMIFVDATCPLVVKVHVEAKRLFQSGKEVLLIGHANHPEVVGTLGQLPDGAISLIETVKDAELYQPANPTNLAIVTQTTLSVDDTSQMIKILKQRFPAITLPHKEDICYATTNRQAAVKAIAGRTDLFLVLGTETSSNSLRLAEVARKAGASRAKLIDDVSHIDWSVFSQVKTLGLTAGASAPESLLQEVITDCRNRFSVHLEEIDGSEENMTFKLPHFLNTVVS